MASFAPRRRLGRVFSGAGGAGPRRLALLGSTAIVLLAAVAVCERSPRAGSARQLAGWLVIAFLFYGAAASWVTSPWMRVMADASTVEAAATAVVRAERSSDIWESLSRTFSRRASTRAPRPRHPGRECNMREEIVAPASKRKS